MLMQYVTFGTSDQRSSRSEFGGRLAKTLVATVNNNIFLFFFRCLLFSERVLGLKVDGSAQKPRGRHLSRPPLPFWGPLAAILDFAGGAALQAVSERPLRR